MKLLLSLLLSLSAVISISSLVCPKYKCSENYQSNCANNSNNNHISVGLCTQDQYCPYNHLPGYHAFTKFEGSLNTEIIEISTNFQQPCLSKPNNPKVDLEACESGSECSSSSCENKVCVGFKENIVCQSTLQCATELYCDASSKTCLKLKEEKSACTVDEECENKSGCYNGKCTEYWSLPLGTLVTSDQIEKFCSTGFSFNGRCMDYKLIEPIPYKCDKFCSYTLPSMGTAVIIKEHCRCGINSIGQSYCEQGSDSHSFNDFVKYIKTLYKKKCHRSKNINCTNKITNDELLTLRSLYYEWKGVYQLSDRCLVKFFSSSKIIVGVHIFLALLIAVLFV